MHPRSSRRIRPASAQLAVICALCLVLHLTADAEPVVLHDGAHTAEATTDTSQLVTLESAPPPIHDMSVSPTTANTAEPKRAPAQATDRTLTPPAGPATQAPPGTTAAPGTNTSIHSAIKESVRPVYDQLVESGAVEALHHLKTDLGLDKNQWSDQDKAAPAKGPGQWDAPATQDPGPPKTAAQAQLDRETASLMREKLIDQVTPWLIGLVVLYVVGYLVKLLYNFIRWKSAKRTERRIARAQRHASRRSRGSSSRPPGASATAPRSQADSQETV